MLKHVQTWYPLSNNDMEIEDNYPASIEMHTEPYANMI